MIGEGGGVLVGEECREWGMVNSFACYDYGKMRGLEDGIAQGVFFQRRRGKKEQFAGKVWMTISMFL